MQAPCLFPVGSPLYPVVPLEIFLYSLSAGLHELFLFFIRQVEFRGLYAQGVNVDGPLSVVAVQVAVGLGVHDSFDDSLGKSKKVVDPVVLELCLVNEYPP